MVKRPQAMGVARLSTPPIPPLSTPLTFTSPLAVVVPLTSRALLPVKRPAGPVPIVLASTAEWLLDALLTVKTPAALPPVVVPTMAAPAPLVWDRSVVPPLLALV